MSKKIHLVQLLLLLVPLLRPIPAFALTSCSVSASINSFGYLEATVSYNTGEAQFDGYQFLDWELRKDGSLLQQGQPTINIGGGGAGLYTVEYNYPDMPLNIGSNYEVKAILNGSQTAGNFSCSGTKTPASSDTFVSYIQGSIFRYDQGATDPSYYFSNVGSCSATGGPPGYSMSWSQGAGGGSMIYACGDPNGGPSLSVPAFFSSSSTTKDTSHSNPAASPTGGSSVTVTFTMADSTAIPTDWKLQVYDDGGNLLSSPQSGTVTPLGSNQYRFTFTPQSDGSHRWNNLEIFYRASSAPPPLPPDHQATCTDVSIPSTMTRGIVYNAYIEMRNDGSNSTWSSTGNNPYRLGSTGPAPNNADRNNLTWSIGDPATVNPLIPANRMSLPSNAAIQPGQTHRFNFTVTPNVPSPGTYNFQWQMVIDDLSNPANQNWFPTACLNRQITVQDPPPQSPVCSLTANPATVSYNSPSTLTWSSTNATSCTSASFGTGGATYSSTGIGTGPLTSTSTYTLTCSNASGSTTCSTQVSVLPPGSNCPGVCGTQASAPDTNGASPGTCFTTGNGWWSWDGKDPNTSANCTGSTPYCYDRCDIPPPAPGATPPTGMQVPTQVYQNVTGPLLWGYVYKDDALNSSFTGNTPLTSAEGANALPQGTAGNYPSGTLQIYAPNLLRGKLTYYAAYSGNHVAPAYNTRTFSFASLPAPTAYQLQDNGGRVFLGQTTSTTGTNGFVNYADYFPVSGMTGLMYVNEKKSGCDWNSSLNQCNGGSSWTEPSEYYTVSNKNGSCAGGCTLQPVPVYSSFTQSPSAFYTLFVNSSCDSQNTYSGYACDCDYTLTTLASCTNSATAGQYTSKFSFCPTNCITTVPLNTCTESCTGSGYSETSGWDMFEGSFKRTVQSPTYTKKVAYGFKKTGAITQAKVVYSGLQISTPKNYFTDSRSGSPALFDDTYTSPVDGSICFCEQNPQTQTRDCTGWGYTCNSLPPMTGNEYRVLPTGNYLFKVASTHPMKFHIRINGIDYPPIAASPDGSGILNFYFTLSGAEGDSVEFDLSTNFTNPNNLPAVTVGTPQLYALGLFEVNVIQTKDSAFNNWCSYPLNITNRPATYPWQPIAQTTDNSRCSGTGGAGFTTTGNSTSIDTSKIIQANILLAPNPSISGKVSLDAGNNNCTSGATGFSGATVNIQGPTNTIAASNGNGDYSAPNLTLGGYTVSLAPISSYTVVTSPPTYSVAVPPNAVNINFCVRRTHTISGNIFLDQSATLSTTQDGIKNSGEQNITLNGTLTITQGGSPKGIAQLNTDGTYQISQLDPGAYTLNYIPPSSYKSTSPVPFTVRVGSPCSIAPTTNQAGTPLPASCNASLNIVNLDIGVVRYSAWVQTTGGDVHTNEQLNTPGGP